MTRMTNVNDKKYKSLDKKRDKYYIHHGVKARSCIRTTSFSMMSTKIHQSTEGVHVDWAFLVFVLQSFYKEPK